jgi:hypothetical protein
VFDPEASARREGLGHPPPRARVLVARHLVRVRVRVRVRVKV